MQLLSLSRMVGRVAGEVTSPMPIAEEVICNFPERIQVILLEDWLKEQKLPHIW